MKKIIILFLFVFLIYITACADNVGLIILKSSGTPCSSSSNSHNIIRDWFEEILIDSLNNQYIFGDSITVLNLYNFSNEENLKQYYQNLIKASYNISDIKTTNHQKLKKETFEKINMRFIGEIEIACLSENNYFILKLFDLKKIVEMRYRYLLPINALSNEIVFKEEMGGFINTVFSTNKEMNLDISSFIWSFNADKISLSLDKDIDVRIKYSKLLDHNIKYEWKIYKLSFITGVNTLFLLEPHVISDKISEMQDSLFHNKTFRVNEKDIRIELIETIHKKELNFNNIDLSGPYYYYIVASKRNPLYNISLRADKTIFVGLHRKNVVGVEMQGEEATNKLEIQFGPYYQRNYRINNLIFGLRATYIVDFRKYKNEEDYFFQSLFISTGPIIGLGEYKTYAIEPFLGFGKSDFNKNISNVITFQVGIRQRLGGIYSRYILPIDGSRSNFFLGVIITIPTYRTK